MPTGDGRPSLYLSKSRFISGLQCHKQLWWRVHEPNARELVPDPALRNRFEQGGEVGRVARGYVPAGELIDLPYHQLDNTLAATDAALRRTPPPPALYEATFFADSTYAQVDILAQLEGRAAFSVIEVKATNRLKPEHIPDVAVQVHVARKSGLPVERAEVMHLNPNCRFPDLSNLFVREDVTARVEGELAGVPDELAEQRDMLAGPLPDVAIGDHCRQPYECPFVERCWNLPKHHVSTLYRIPRNQVLDYESQGFDTIRDLPSDLELGVIHARQVRAVTTGRMVVEPTLVRALVEFRSPLAFLDFETVSLAIPVWDGCRPWEMVPAQFSCHTEGPRGRLTHYEWIADGPGDPRPAIAEQLVDACAGARRVVAYYASFERDCLRQLAAAVPARAAELHAIADKLVDLLPLVRNHIYHPDFGGSFSIKRVLPALVPGLSYDDLKIGGGELASVELLRLMLHGDRLSADERAALRHALSRYCERDTWAMVKLWERVRGLVGGQLELF
jgi:predicted RecB family nuclease